MSSLIVVIGPAFHDMWSCGGGRGTHCGRGVRSRLEDASDPSFVYNLGVRTMGKQAVGTNYYDFILIEGISFALGLPKECIFMAWIRSHIVG